MHRYMPALGRFLIVVTFLEDALRIVTQFGDQVFYLTTYRMPWGLAHIFLILNVCVLALLWRVSGANDSGYVGWKLYGHCA
jgi:hypothetical protein